jgi:hypothetical protein
MSDLALNMAFGTERIFLSVASVKTKKILAICNYIFPPINAINIKNTDINRLIDNLSKLQTTEKIISPSLKYKTVTYTVLDYEATLIPTKYFNEKEKEKYLKILFPQSKNSTVFTEKIPQIKAIAVSAIDPIYPAAISIPYNKAKYKSVYSVLIKKIFTLPEKSIFTANVLLHVCDNAFELTIKKSNRLIFINTFQYKRKSDILYYFLYTLNKLGLDIGAIAVFLCGKAKEINLLNDIKIHAYHSTYYKDNDNFLLIT